MMEILSQQPETKPGSESVPHFPTISPCPASEILLCGPAKRRVCLNQPKSVPRSPAVGERMYTPIRVTVHKQCPL